MTGSSHRNAALAVVALAVACVLPVALAPAAASLSITKTDSADPVAPNTQFTYDIQISNGGADGAPGVVVTDELPSQVEFVSATSSQGGACDLQGKKVTCALGEIASGASASVQIRVESRQPGQLTNTATVSSTEPYYAEEKSDSEATTVSEAPPGPTCGGRPATIVGTESADTLAGTFKRDVIVALGGNDRVTAVGGRDIVCGSLGDDLARGGPGADNLRGGFGNDRLRGGGGGDTLAGGPRRDRLFGGVGDDVLFGGRGIDTCVGGFGNDTKRLC